VILTLKLAALLLLLKNFLLRMLVKGYGLKLSVSLNGNPSQSNGASPAIRDHTRLLHDTGEHRRLTCALRFWGRGFSAVMLNISRFFYILRWCRPMIKYIVCIHWYSCK